MKVSVIVPIYNVENYIVRCVQSLFRQTYSDIEFVFVDDASTDNSIALLEEQIANTPAVKDSVLLLRSEVNQGCAAARLKGMKAATGDYIIQVDSDDWVADDYIEQLITVAVNSNADVVICDFYYYYGKKLERKNVMAPQDPELCLAMQLSGEIYNSLWNKLVKRDIIVSNDIYPLPGLNMCEDKLVMTKVMYFASTIRYIPQPLYYYNKTSHGTVSSQDKKRLIPELLGIVGEIDSFFADKTISSNVRQSINFFKSSIMGLVLIHGDKQMIDAIKNMFNDISCNEVIKQPVMPFYYKLADLSYLWHFPLGYMFVRWSIAFGKMLVRLCK